jgi:uncharacterized protein (TIGR02145 family)
MKTWIYLLMTLALTSCVTLRPTETGTFTDTRDGHVYRWVKLKNQIWMAQNLDFAIKHAHYFQNDSLYFNQLGLIYHYSVAEKACPAGWHIPTDDEWGQLEMAGGMSSSDITLEGYRGSISTDFLEKGSTKMNVLFTGIPNEVSPLGREYEVVRFWTSTSIEKSHFTRNFRLNGSRIGRFLLGNNHEAYIRCIKNDASTEGLIVDPVTVKK